MDEYKTVTLYTPSGEKRYSTDPLSQETRILGASTFFLANEDLQVQAHGVRLYFPGYKEEFVAVPYSVKTYVRDAKQESQ